MYSKQFHTEVRVDKSSFRNKKYSLNSLSPTEFFVFD